MQLFEDVLQERRALGTTVLLSTHQMNKVEQLCDRALLINRGHMVMYGAVRDLRRKYAEHAMLVRGSAVPDGLPGVVRSDLVDGQTKLLLERDTRPTAVLRALVERGVDLESFSVESLPLEDLFVKVVHEGIGLDRGQSGPPTVDQAVAGGAR